MKNTKLLIALCLAGSMTYAQTITTIAGDGNANFSGDGGPATSAEIHSPTGVAFDPSGNMYFIDAGNNRIRKVDASGKITTIAGTGSSSYSGDGGAATSAGMAPTAIAIDASGNIYVGGNSRIRKINTSGTINTIAGTGVMGFYGDSGPATSAKFAYVNGIALDGAGNLYFSDQGNNDVRKIDVSGNINTYAGNRTPGLSGDTGPAASAELYYPTGLTCDASGNLYIADQGNNRVRWVNSSGNIYTFAGTGSLTSGGSFSGDGSAATAAGLDNPSGLVFDAAGNLYISDELNNRIRKVNTSGIISTIAGTGYGSPTSGGYSGDGGVPTSAEMYFPFALSINSVGTIYIADYGNNRVRAIVPPLCTANAGSNVTDYSSAGSLCAGVQIGTSSTGFNYSWSPTTALSCNNCAQPTCSYNNTVTPQIYTLTVSGIGCLTATSSVQVNTVAQSITTHIINTHAINGSNITAQGTYTANFTPTYYFWSITQCNSDGSTYTGGTPYSWNSGYVSGAPSGVYTFPSTASLPCNTYYYLWFWTGNSCAGQWVQSPVFQTTLDPNTVISTAVVSTGNHSVTATYPSDNPSGYSYWWDVVELDGGGNPISTTEINNPGCWYTNYTPASGPNKFWGYENNSYSSTLCASGVVGNFTSPNSYQISFGVWSSTCAWIEKVQILSFCGSGCRIEESSGESSGEYIITENPNALHHSNYLEAIQSEASISNPKIDVSSLINIYPNPNAGNFTLNSNSSLPQLMQIFDVNGKVVLSQTINGNTSINANNLPDGVYNVNLTGNNSVTNKKLVIVR